MRTDKVGECHLAKQVNDVHPKSPTPFSPVTPLLGICPKETCHILEDIFFFSPSFYIYLFIEVLGI
jgi:hypothetical protein